MKNRGPCLLSELSSLQVKGEMCDTRLVADNGSLMVHWAVLEVRGVWWCGTRPQSLNTVIFPGVNITQLTDFVNRIYCQSHSYNTGGLTSKKLRVRIEKLPPEFLEKLEIEDSVEVKYEVPDSPEQTYHEEYSNEFNEFDQKSEESDQEDADYDRQSEDGSDDENKSMPVLSNFYQQLVNGEHDRIAESEFNRKRSEYPAIINIDKEIMKTAVANIKINTQEVGPHTYFCALCNFKNRKKNLILRHMIVHFKNMQVCTICDKGVGNVGRHLESRHSVKPVKEFECDICFKKMRNLGNMSKHKRSHELVYCDQCEFVCEGREKLSRHIQKKHQAPVICPICDKALGSSDYLKTHLALHGNESFSCDQCGNNYKSLKMLKIHIYSSHNDKEYQCEFCQKKFQSNSIYNRHMKTRHQKVKNHHCPTCDYKATTKSYLTAHMRVHESPRYSCSHCGKTFRQATALRSHVMTHTGQRPYGCDQCSFRCIQPGDLRKHFLNQHGKVIEKPGHYMSVMSAPV